MTQRPSFNPAPRHQTPQSRLATPHAQALPPRASATQATSKPSPRTLKPNKTRKPSRFEAPVRDFLTYCKVECGFAPATLAAYAGDIRDLWVELAQLGHTTWEDLTHEIITDHLKNLRDQRAMELTSIARHVATIRVFCRFTHTAGTIEENPAEWLEQPETWQKLPTVMHDEQVKQLLAAPQPSDALYLRDVALLELLYAGGLRASELADMDQTAIHFELGVCRIMGKGNKERPSPSADPPSEPSNATSTSSAPTSKSPASPANASS